MADVVYPLKMTADLYGQVKAAADAADMSAAAWVRQAIRDKLGGS